MATAEGKPPDDGDKPDDSGDKNDNDNRALDENMSVPNKLTCAVCLETFRRPKMLSCFHTFCQSCVQAVAGTSPSFPCPACRTVILLPPEGVSALQNNYYVEQELGQMTSSPPRRLCDVCSEDSEATYSCIQCRQRFCTACRRFHDAIATCRGHSVVPLTPETEGEGACGGTDADRSGQGNRRKGKMEEWCSKHSDQRLVLRCTRCAQNICIQCKLTRHDGHPTEDLNDAGAKVKDKLKAVLEDMTLTVQRLEQLKAAIDERRSRLQQEGEKVERELQGRADKFKRWVNQALDDTVGDVKAVISELDVSLQQQSQLTKGRLAALRRRHDHVATVLTLGTDTELVDLDAQLAATAAVGGDDDDVYSLKDIERALKKDVPCLATKHDQLAIQRAHIVAFIGSVVKPANPSTDNVPDPGTHAATASQHSLKQASANVPASSSLPSNPNGARKVREFVYSRNTSAAVHAICPISNERLWVCFKPSDDSCKMMKLFDAEGRNVCTVSECVYGSDLVAVKNDFVLGEGDSTFSVDILQPDGTLKSTSFKFDAVTFLAGAACGFQFCKDFDKSNYYRIHVTSVDPFKHTNELVLENTPCLVRDISKKSLYFAAIVGTTAVVYKIDSRSSFTKLTSYKPETDSPIDVRFCLINGQEMLLVLVSDNSVHIVDFLDGARLTGKLDTGPIALSRPRRLYTDYDKHVWIGCDGGKVVVVDL